MVGNKKNVLSPHAKPNSHSATNHDGELCVPDSDTSIVVPYSAAPMCQFADALRFGHVRACLPTIWYVPVHILPYHRGIDPSERSQRAAYCLQQRCLVRPCVPGSIYQFSIAPIGEMAPGVPCKALNKIIQLHYRTGMREMAPIGEMVPGCVKKYKKEILKNPFAPGAISRMITVLV